MSQPRTLGRNSKQLGEVAHAESGGGGRERFSDHCQLASITAGALRPDLFCSRPRLPRYLSLFGWISR